MIEINNLTPIFINKNFLKKVAEKILKKEKKSLKLSIALLEPDKIKKLNKKYRKENKITDVLSFLYNNGSGELIICPQEVKKDAKKIGISFKKELSRVLIHGMLHLLGEDHELSKKKAKRMEIKQGYYVKLFFR